jgi:hypothetical protein
MSRAEPVAKCRSCGASIIWTDTVTGRRMPLDANPTTDGNIILGVRHGNVPLALVQTAQALARLKEYGSPLYTSHFATCPHADNHRRNH